MDNARIEGLLPLTPVVFHTLLALSEGIKHGYAIAQEVERASRNRVRMGPGTLYGTLRRILEQRLVEETSNPGERASHAERRRYYRLTPLGRTALHAEASRLSYLARLAADRGVLGPEG